jgi:F-type H+-transporting ATPase subunit b
MPQFDFTTYASQVFWFLLCFTALYLTIYFVIVPRLTTIINTRSNIINLNTATAQELQIKIDNLNNQSKLMRIEAQTSYQINIANASKQIAGERDLAITKLKNEIAVANKDLQKKIQNFIKDSAEQNQQQIQSLAQFIKNQILS